MRGDVVSSPPAVAPLSVPAAAGKRTPVLQALACGTALFFLYWSFRDADLAKAWQTIVGLGPVVLLLLVPYGISVLLDACGFRLLFAALGRSVRPLRLAGIRLSAEGLASSLPGGAVLAETMKPMLLRARCEVPLPEGASAIAARKCLIVSAHGLYLSLAVVLGWSFLADRSQRAIGLDGLAWLAALVALALLLTGALLGRAIGSGSSVATLHGWLARIPIPALRRWLGSRRQDFGRADEHLGRTLRWKTAAAAAPWYLGMWIAEACETWLLLQLLGLPLGFAEALALEAVISVVRALAFFVPAGLGFQDAGYVAWLRGGPAGDAASLAAAFALLKRAREIGWICIGLLILAAHTRLTQAPRAPRSPGAVQPVVASPRVDG